MSEQKPILKVNENNVWEFKYTHTDNDELNSSETSFPIDFMEKLKKNVAFKWAGLTFSPRQHKENLRKSNKESSRIKQQDAKQCKHKHQNEHNNSSITSDDEDPNSTNESVYECNICLSTAKNAVVGMCGHLFCWPCLNQWLMTRPRRPSCPVCKSVIGPDNVIPLYGRNSSAQIDPREQIAPPRPAGRRTELPALHPPHWYLLRTPPVVIPGDQCFMCRTGFILCFGLTITIFCINMLASKFSLIELIRDFLVSMLDVVLFKTPDIVEADSPSKILSTISMFVVICFIRYMIFKW